MFIAIIGGWRYGHATIFSGATPDLTEANLVLLSPYISPTPTFSLPTTQPNPTRLFIAALHCSFFCLDLWLCFSSCFVSMADAERKRPREESEDDSPAEKRPCSTTSSSSFQSILSLLESDEESPAEDVSSLISSLQEEICSAGAAAEPAGPVPAASEECGGDEVIRHLLEASDVELGIPAEDEEERREAEESGAVGEISNYDVFWELEEEAANYYALFQSPESFMA